MKRIVKNMLADKAKTMPILSFPSARLLGVTVSELLSSPEMQAKGMKSIQDRCPVSVGVSMMDLSVEAEAFGAEVRFFEDEVPVVTKGIIEDIEQVADIVVPAIGTGRTALYVQAVCEAKKQITDIPVFCGCIGPYSLASRLFDMTELMYACFDDEENTLLLLEKATQFIISYIKAFKAAGADGVVLAEPVAGMLSPNLAKQFSDPFVTRIFDAVQDETFVTVYHNCGNAVANMKENLSNLPADVFHFGNAVKLSEMLPAFSKDKVVMGNVDPVLFRTGTAEEIQKQTKTVLEECSCFENFMLSSGCDIPADAKWENLDAYFKTVGGFYV
ncbi:MAG: uroporphyrinogen decarboxylase family protein [Clostridia bacterium]|nr:uroporphyrinogen decarboxylase family protein [Clostridia bacterium]